MLLAHIKHMETIRDITEEEEEEEEEEERKKEEEEMWGKGRKDYVIFQFFSILSVDKIS